ncbi:hypothetical protein D3C72_1651160 [compost metagenome]
MPGTIMSSTQPEADSTSPNTNTPIQNHIFSPALKRPLGTCLPDARPPRLVTQRMSSRLGRLSRTNTTKATITDSVKIGPITLCRFFST